MAENIMVINPDNKEKEYLKAIKAEVLKRLFLVKGGE
jgi:hypothetical protein